jgi:hypothetical protein
LKKCDLREDIFNYKHNGCIYLKTAVKGGGRTNSQKWYQKYLPMIDKNVKKQELVESWVDFEMKCRVDWNPERLKNSDYRTWIDKMENEIMRQQEYYKHSVLRESIIKKLWYGLPYNDFIAPLLVKNKVMMFIERMKLLDILWKIKEKINILYPVEIEIRRARAIEKCRREKDIICERDEMKMINNLNMFALISDTIVMDRVKCLRLQVVQLIEERIYQIYPVDMQAERENYI